MDKRITVLLFLIKKAACLFLYNYEIIWIMNWINSINTFLWSYVLIILLLGCAVWFTFKTRFVQFRLIGEMFRLLGNSAGTKRQREKHVSSFQAFAISLASRVGTGNMAGVALAIAIGDLYFGCGL